MAETVQPRVQVIAWTHFQQPCDVPWSTDAEGGQALAEFAGRACYQSWSKPNPATATNAGYLQHILEVGHMSVLEHGVVTFYFTGVSRSLTHELVRHRHFSYSQLSQRYVPEGDAAMVEPEVIAADQQLHQLFQVATNTSLAAYREMVELLAKPVCPVCETRGEWQTATEAYCESCGAQFIVTKADTPSRKAIRQAARAVLPNATETRIVVTGNYRAWRHFIAMRATEHADVEIRQLALELLRQLQQHAPNVFGDFVIVRLDDGTEFAHSDHSEI